MQSQGNHMTVLQYQLPCRECGSTLGHGRSMGLKSEHEGSYTWVCRSAKQSTVCGNHGNMIGTCCVVVGQWVVSMMPLTGEAVAASIQAEIHTHDIWCAVCVCTSLQCQRQIVHHSSVGVSPLPSQQAQVLLAVRAAVFLFGGCHDFGLLQVSWFVGLVFLLHSRLMGSGRGLWCFWVGLVSVRSASCVATQFTKLPGVVEHGVWTCVFVSGM